MTEDDFKRVAYALDDSYGCEDDDEAFEVLESHLHLFPDVAIELKHAFLNVLTDGRPEDCLQLVKKRANRYVDDAEEARTWLAQLKERLFPLG